LLLQNLGVPGEYFLTLQKEHMHHLSLLKIQEVCEQIKQLRYTNPDEIEAKEQLIASDLNILVSNLNNFKQEFKDAIFKGIDIKSDPVLSSIYLAKEINQLLLMRKKNRIMLQDSCSLIGVIDADGHLEEGEVFVQIRKDNIL